MNFFVLSSSATSSSQNFEFEPVVEEMELVEQMDQMDEIEEVEEEVKQTNKAEQENLAPHIYRDH